MELRDIEYFAVMAEHGNVRRASEALGLSPPALSKSLRRLEQSLQARIFKRTPKGIELTAVGSALLAQVKRIRVMLADVAREATDLSQGLAGHLRIGVGPAIAELLPAAYAALLDEAPRLTAAIEISDNDVMFPALRNGTLDLIFNVIPEFSMSGLTVEPLFDDDFVVCASARHRLAKSKRVPMSALANERWVLSTPNIPTQQLLERAFRERGMRPPACAVEVRSARMRLQLVAATDLLGYMSTKALRAVSRSLRVRELPVNDLKLRRSIGVIYREEAYLSPSARRLIGILKQQYRA
ncbi:MAG TPA: LysR family transcriptional regulator [Burkholderiales bacterium]|nr:LysR family transcriptional regulator [Burkholderiales bacterium]